MENFKTLLFAANGPVATITFNRPDSGNAFHDDLVTELLHCVLALRDDGRFHDVRAVVLRSVGPSFCTGDEVRTPLGDSAALARVDELLRVVDELPQVVIARVQGLACGGGLGLVCVSDIAIAGYSASFALSEVHMGLTPAIILPYVVERLGVTRTRQLLVTGASVDYTQAYADGLIQHYCADNELDARVRAVLKDVLQGAPQALRESKRLLNAIRRGSSTLEERIALLRRQHAGEEAQEARNALLEGRAPNWVVDP